MPSIQGPLGNEMLRHIDQHVGQRLKVGRESLDVSPDELSGHLSVSTRVLRRYEAGETSIPASDLYRAARFLGVKIEFFYEELVPKSKSRRNGRKTAVGR